VLLVFDVVCYNWKQNFLGEQMVAKKVSKEASKVASKVEDKQLRDYELVLIISPEVVDEALDTAIKSISQFITEKGGIISEVEQWGKRKLAYPIEHFMEGSYVLTRFKSEPILNKELEANLKMSEEVLRHLLIRVGD
jgi:small subunit ribosomal protein S6